jgi:hypothetical protein
LRDGESPRLPTDHTLLTSTPKTHRLPGGCNTTRARAPANLPGRWYASAWMTDPHPRSTRPDGRQEHRELQVRNPFFKPSSVHRGRRSVGSSG